LPFSLGFFHLCNLRNLRSLPRLVAKTDLNADFTDFADFAEATVKDLAARRAMMSGWAGPTAARSFMIAFADCHILLAFSSVQSAESAFPLLGLPWRVPS
jgi:hypothetical protein